MSNDILRLELERVKAVLDGAAMAWAVAAGMAVYLYTGNRPPTDLDIIVRPEDLPRAGRLLGSLPETKRSTWGEVSELTSGSAEIVGSLTIKKAGRSYAYRMDDEMVNRIRHVAFGGMDVPVLAPEDLVALKAVLQRGPDQGKHDLEDVAAIAGRLRIDTAYLRGRLQRMGAEKIAGPVLEQWGWV